MKRTLPRILRRFRREEKGAALIIEFVIFVPMLFAAFMMTAELGLYSVQRMFLDRGLDIAVRHIRLNTTNPLDYAELKQKICDHAGFIDDCETSLRLEMRPINPRSFNLVDPTSDCATVYGDVQPVRGLTLGQQQELMLVRACVPFDPIYPTSGLGYSLLNLEDGRFKMVSTAAFVQEPG
jgi:hypothetical protein